MEFSPVFARPWDGALTRSIHNLPNNEGDFPTSPKSRLPPSPVSQSPSLALTNDPRSSMSGDLADIIWSRMTRSRTIVSSYAFVHMVLAFWSTRASHMQGFREKTKLSTNLRILN